MLTFLVTSPIIIAVFLFAFSGAKSARIIVIGVQTALVGFAFHLFTQSRIETVYTIVGDYAGFLGIILRADNLAAVFILLSTIIFLVVTIYCLNAEHSRTFWFLLFLLQASLIGLFLTRDFFNAFVLIEVSTIVVTILLMYDRKRRHMFFGMLFLMVNIIVMQFYLFGTGYLYMLAGTLDFNGVSAAIAGMEQRSLVLPYALIMTAIASKCSLLPMLTWLPKVNAIPGAPSSITAILSGLHIKSGLYMFVRFQDVFGEFAARDFFLIVGIITGFAGIILALSQKNIRLILAYSTIAQIGLIMIGLNMDAVNYYYAYYGSLFHIINHALLKSSLFLGAGIIIGLYGTMDISKIRGLWYTHRLLAIATILAILGIMGTPLFNGSVSKYFMMREASGLHEWAMILLNLGTILVFIKYASILFKRPEEDAVKPASMDWFKLTPVMFFGAASLFLGIFGEQFKNFLFDLEVHIEALGYLQKVGIFFASLAVGLIITKFMPKEAKLFIFLRNANLGFKGIITSLGAFFALMLIGSAFFG